MNGQLRSLARFLHRLTSPPADGDVTDQQLLERYSVTRDEAAFATLLERHGPMVHGVCRRALADSNDADDAFQATFLVLARKAHAVRWHESVAGWLHQVAWRVARKARTAAARDAGLTRRLEASPMASDDPLDDATRRDLRAALDEELAHLPEKYRLPLVLCYLEGRTNEEAASQLGWSKGTVSGRLARARDMLRPRLVRRGLTLSAASLAAVLAEQASAAVSPALSRATLNAVAGTASANVVTLAEGALRTMFLTRLKIATVVVLTLCLLGTGAAVLTFHALAGDQPQVEKDPKPNPAEEPPAKVTFLEKVDGKPPLRSFFVTLELTNRKDKPVWLVTRSNGEKPLAEAGKFKAHDTTPQMFVGDGFDGKKGGGKGTAVEVRYIGEFRAFLLPAGATVKFERFGIGCWDDIRQFEVWEVSTLKVNGRTPLEKWLPYPVASGGDVVIPARTEPKNLDWDPNTSRSRTDYPEEKIESVSAEVIKKWLLPIAGLDGNAKGKPKTDREQLQGPWHLVSVEWKGKPLTEQELEKIPRKVVIEGDDFLEYRGDIANASVMKLDPTKKPKTMDWLVSTNIIENGVKRVEESVTGRLIYELDGDTLKIAQTSDGSRPTGFQTAPDSKTSVSVYKRGEPPAKPDKQPQPEFVEAEVTLHLGRDGVKDEAAKSMTKTVKDKATLAKLVSCFPEMGRGKESGIFGGWIPRVTIKFQGSKGETVTVNSIWTNWTEGKGDWLVKANLMKYAGELFEVQRLIDQGNLVDDWKIVSIEEDGKGVDIKGKEFGASLDSFGLYVGDKTEFEADEYELRPDKTPKEIDLYIDFGTKDQKHYRGIYDLQGDTLKVCFDKGGTDRPTEFKTEAGKTAKVLLVLKRVGGTKE